MLSTRPSAPNPPNMTAVQRGDRLAGPALTTATVSLGLVGGLFFAFDVAVMPGLSAVDDPTFVTVMQRINVAIENGLFGLVFVGAFLATAVAAVLRHRLGGHRAARWIWVALACYTLALVITATVNIPLNNELARVVNPATAPGLAEVRHGFEGSWRLANAFRTVACTAGLGSLARALVLYGRARTATN